MNVKNLETAERFAKKRRNLNELLNLLGSYTHKAEVKIIVNLWDGKTKEATIKDEVFNALMYKLVESEIKNIDDFVESL